MKTEFCPVCEATRGVRAIKATEQFDIRGVTIPVDVEYLKCETCEADFDAPGVTDPLVTAFREYRSRKGFVQPEEIHEFRKRFGLTQYELSRLLGWGATTLSRYENGALQDEAHDCALHMIMKPDNLCETLERQPEAVLSDKRRHIIATIRSGVAVESEQREYIENWMNVREPDELSGYRRFCADKFFNAVLFFCRDSGVPKTKLNKLLWYSDNVHFKEHTVSITGARYAHCPHGPAPDKYESLFAFLTDQTGELRTEVKFYRDSVWEDFVSTRAPSLDVFTKTELRILASVDEFFSKFTARKISDYSHEEEGYKATESGELISFEYASSLRI